MNRKSYICCCFLVLTFAGLGGCSSGPSGKDAKKTVTLDKIQGKAQEVIAESTASDAAMNAGGPSVYLWDGLRRYRLFLRTAATIEPGKEYIAEGINAQKAIDEIGDPDQGKNGYPLQSSCDRVVRMAWPGLAFDVTDAHSTVVCERVKRYPARPVFLVTRLRPVTPKDGAAGSAEAKKSADAEEEDVPEITVPAEKQSALLIAGQPVQTAPLWAPAGGTVHCKLTIDQEGKVSQLDTGAQLCESVDWSQFRYKPTVQRGHPVKVKTEVEVRFDARK